MGSNGMAPFKVGRIGSCHSRLLPLYWSSARRVVVGRGVAGQSSHLRVLNDHNFFTSFVYFFTPCVYVIVQERSRREAV